jgi:hypothetical protein
MRSAVRSVVMTTALLMTAVLMTAVMTMLPAAPSWAERTPGAAGTAAPTHCVLRATPRGGTEEPPTCFGSFRAAIAFATDGRVTDAPESASRATDAAFATRLDAPDTTTAAVLGIDYADINFHGSTLTLSAAGGCDNNIDVDWQFPTLPAAWNDRISSFRSFSNCLQQLFRDVNFGVAITSRLVSSAWVGAAANDRASSIRFY